MKLVILGRTEILFDTITKILDDTPHKILSIITAKESPEYQKTNQQFKDLADTKDISFIYTQTIDSNVRDFVKSLKADICISLNWVSVIDQQFIDLFQHGIINAHFGNLPQYRGNAVTNWALLRGESEIFLTLHKMIGGEIDSGPILLKTKMDLTEKTNINEINQFAQNHVPEMFIKVLSQIDSGNISETPQESLPLSPFRCFPRLPCDGKITWNNSAVDIDRLIRSLTKPYSGAYTYYLDAKKKLKKLYIWKVKIITEKTQDIGIAGSIIKNDPHTGESHILCGQGILSLLHVSHESNDDFFKPGQKWKSIRFRLGLCTEDILYEMYKTQIPKEK